MQKIRLLILSEYPIVRSALRHLLSSGQEIEVVGEADNQQTAEQAIHRLRPDVVLLETTEGSEPRIPELTEKARHSRKPAFVVLTNQSNVHLVRTMLKAGVTGYVLKRSTEAELLSAVRSAARGLKFLDPGLVDVVALEVPGWAVRRAEGAPVLSRREFEVLTHLVQGETGPDIARDLHVSVKTVETYRSRIYEKLDLHSRADLVRHAASIGLVSIKRLPKVGT